MRLGVIGGGRTYEDGRRHERRASRYDTDDRRIRVYNVYPLDARDYDRSCYRERERRSSWV